jgi:hypothetical protein
MNQNLPATHPCGAHLQDARRTCTVRVRAPRVYCGTHQRQYNRITNNGEHPDAWDEHIHRMNQRANRAEEQMRQFINTHPVMSRFPEMPTQERIQRYGHHTALFFEINEVLHEVTGYIFPSQVLRVVVLNNIPEPHRTYLTGLADRVNRALDDLWHRGRDIRPDREAMIADILANAPRRRQLGELGRFANDNQNVHLTATVQMVKTVVDRVLKIPVPTDWSHTGGNRTPGEILTCVRMSGETAVWFVKKYVANEDIYEYGPKIYAKVVDAVWQYICQSPDKNDLCTILGTELSDSVGMCAQGNLTRICNVLAGYLEGVNTETQGEQLQRRMANLMQLETPEERIREGKKILEELAVPLDQHDAWIEALS